jgi:hypothetical protein
MGKGWLRIVAGAAIGLVVGMGVRAFLLRPPRWEKLPPTASPVKEIDIFFSGPLAVRTADGSSLKLSDDGKFEPSLPVPNAPACYYPLAEPCDASLPRRSGLSGWGAARPLILHPNNAWSIRTILPGVAIRPPKRFHC